jgi:hypothetical protein
MCSLSAIPAVIGRQEVAGPRLALFERERPLISTRLFEGGDYFDVIMRVSSRGIGIASYLI